MSIAGRSAGYGKPLAPGTPERPHARLSVTDCVRHTLTHDPDVAPLTPAELRAVEARAASAIAGKGPTWWNPDA